MTSDEFDVFKMKSQQNFAADFAKFERISLADAFENALRQFDRLVPKGLVTEGQFFYEAVEKKTNGAIGFLWLGLSEKFGVKTVSINDVFVREELQGQGYGHELMRLTEEKAKEFGATRIRLHVFGENRAALQLYLKSGFRTTSFNMTKIL